MSIATIRSTAETLVGQKLGSDFKVLPYRYDANANDSRALDSGYSVMWGDAQEYLGSGVIDQLVNIEQDLDVTITKRAFVRNDDSRTIAVVDTLYTSIATILKAFIQGRIGLTDSVREVRLVSMSRPEPLSDDQRDIIKIEMKFQVRYLIT